jgi:hypothetical protein
VLGKGTYAERVVVKEGRVPSQHLENEDTERPPIYGFSVSLALNDFRRKVLGCSTLLKSSTIASM